jgi:hypothetical protein
VRTAASQKPIEVSRVDPAVKAATTGSSRLRFESRRCYFPTARTQAFLDRAIFPEARRRADHVHPWARRGVYVGRPPPAPAPGNRGGAKASGCCRRPATADRPAPLKEEIPSFLRCRRNVSPEMPASQCRFDGGMMWFSMGRLPARLRFNEITQRRLEPDRRCGRRHNAQLGRELMLRFRVKRRVR